MPLSLFCFNADPSKYSSYTETSFSQLERAYKCKDIHVPITEILSLCLIDQKSLSTEKAQLAFLNPEDQELLTLGNKGNISQFPAHTPGFSPSLMRPMTESASENSQRLFSWLRKHEPWQVKAGGKSIIDR